MNSIIKNNQFSVIYTFEVKPNLIDEFIKGWAGLTKLIYKHEGSFGSRLHKSGENRYVAYAQWPSKEVWENAGKKLPNESNQFKIMMKDSCHHIDTIFELEIIEDLLMNKQF